MFIELFEKEETSEKSVQRFLSLDPLAAEYPAWSDYNYVLGNPVMLIDPDGRSATPGVYVDEDGQEIYNDGETDNKVYTISRENFSLPSGAPSAETIYDHNAANITNTNTSARASQPNSPSNGPSISQAPLKYVAPKETSAEVAGFYYERSANLSIGASGKAEIKLGGVVTGLNIGADSPIVEQKDRIAFSGGSSSELKNNVNSEFISVNKSISGGLVVGGSFVHSESYRKIDSELYSQDDASRRYTLSVGAFSISTDDNQNLDFHLNFSMSAGILVSGSFDHEVGYRVNWLK